jgi:hypothetical protein
LSCIPLRCTREPVLLWLHHEYTYIHITCSAGWGLTLTVLDMNFCYYLLGLFFPFAGLFIIIPFPLNLFACRFFFDVLFHFAHLTFNVLWRCKVFFVVFFK